MVLVLIVKLNLARKKSSLLDASFHMSVNHNDNHHGGPTLHGNFRKAADANVVVRR